MVTAKVKCTLKQSFGEGDNQYTQVSFQPDYDDGRNAEWAYFTPSLSLTMNVNNQAAEHFQGDSAYILQFVPEGSEDAPAE